MADIPVGLQLHTVRKEAEGNLGQVLESVAAMGYEGVEFAGYYGYAAQTIRELLDAGGLKCCGSHMGITAFFGDELARTIAFNRSLDNNYLICSGLPEAYRGSREAWLRTAELFNRLAAQLEPEGMRIGYHNHLHEFHPLPGGETPWELFFSNTSPRVIMQIDTGNALAAGADPVAKVRNYPGRATSVHLKEYSSANEQAIIGEGDVPWAEFLDTCEKYGDVAWYVVEQESAALPCMKCARRCLKRLRDMGV